MSPNVELTIMSSSNGIMLIDSAEDADEILPAASVAFAVMLWVPSASADAGVNDHAPVLLWAEVVPNEVVPENSWTVLLASAVPVNVGVLSVVLLSVEELPLSVLVLRSGVAGAEGGVESHWPDDQWAITQWCNGTSFISTTVTSLYRPALARSEERRVGKECRSRWSPYH